MKPVLRLLLLTLAAFLGSLSASPEAEAVGWKTAPDEIFCGTLEDAGENGPSAREQCRINGWLNYDTASGCTVAANTTKALPAPKVRGNPNTATTYEKIVVDAKGNAIPLKQGESLTGSPDGRFIQVRDANGNPTGLRIDGPHNPASHPDPRAQAPHAHVPGVTNPDGTPWLPVNQ